MLDTVDLSLALSKKATAQVIRQQQERLFELAEMTFERKIPVIVVFEGWDAAGKGTNIAKITERLDPRGFKVLPTRAPLPHELHKPWLWRFWMNIPRHGQIAIFDRSWYGRVLVERVAGLTAIPDWIRAYEEINAFERTLAADGTVFVKFFLHISKAEQLRRFITLTQTPEMAWQVTADDWEQHRRYDEYVAAVNDMLVNTSTAVAPWEVVPATDKYYCRLRIFQTLIRRLENALQMAPSPEPNVEILELSASERGEDEKAKKAEKRMEKAAQKAAKKAQKTEARLALAGGQPKVGKVEKRKKKTKNQRANGDGLEIAVSMNGEEKIDA